MMRFRRWSLRQRLAALLVLASGLLLTASWVAWEARRYERTNHERSVENLQLRLAVRRLQDFYGYGVVRWSQQVARGTLPAKEALRQLGIERTWVTGSWGAIAAAAGKERYRRHQLDSLLDLRGSVDRTLEGLEHALAAQDLAGLPRYFTLQDDAPRAQLIERSSRLVNDLRVREAEDIGYGEQHHRELISYGIAAGAIAGLFLLVSFALRNIYGDVAWLTARARRIAARESDAGFERVLDGELGELAQAFVTMQEAVGRYEKESHERELEARAASQSKSVFLTTMSHEIRTPLVGVLGMLEVIEHTTLDAEQRRQFSIVRQSARALLDIIGDVLDYSKIEAGKLQLDEKPVAVAGLIARLISAFSASAVSKGLRLHQVIDSSVEPAHRADGVRLTQILRNLVGNAIKFTERGSVTLAVRVIGCDPGGGQKLSFSVADTGIGMTAEQLGRIFEPFVQAEAGTARRYGGTGLGLVICESLAALMGGVVRAESTPGQGTVMTLELTLRAANPADIAVPDVQENAPIRPRAAPTREQAEREGTLLLLAEDNPVNRDVLTAQLKLAGFAVDAAADGTLALAAFTARRYALVLSDLHMPGLDGYQLTAGIREFERVAGRARTPIIALTANVVREDVERCFAAGMDDYVSKPVTIRQLVAKMDQWLPQLAERPASAPSPSLPREAPGDAPVDEKLLMDQTGLDLAGARSVLAEFCRVTAADLLRLEAGAAMDGDELRALAHRMKGAALVVGAHDVVDAVARLEQLPPGAPGASVAAHVARLREAFARVEAYVGRQQR